MPKSYSIVGMNFQKSEAFLAEQKAGVAAVLIREPNNQYDTNAVAVWIEGKRVGYIPKKQNVVLAAFIDQTGVIAEDLIAMDQDLARNRAITGVFVRSPNSGYPMVQV